MNELDSCATYRTVESYTRNYLNWSKSGKLKKNAKIFKDCINVPVFSGEEDVIVLDVIPPLGLHLLLGVVNTLFSHMLNPTFASQFFQNTGGKS